MSVISATNMLVQDCIFQTTRGTPPESGIDFEPDDDGDRLSNITLINVSTFRNHGNGFSIWPGNLRHNRLPITIHFINCSNAADGISGINIGYVDNPGQIEFDGHLVDSSVGAGIYLNGASDLPLPVRARAGVVLRNSVVKNASAQVVQDVVYVDGRDNPLPTPPILLGCMDNRSRCGNVHFENVTVDDTACGYARPFLAVGYRGHPKSWTKYHKPSWNGTAWSKDVEGLGMTMHD